MARRKKKGPKQVETLTHDEATRKNIPTAELQSAAQRAEEINPFKPVTYLREDPLPKGETRPRDEDLDPQIVWKGATLRLSPDQIAQLTETGKLEIGDVQLVWRGKDQQDWSDLVVQAPPLYIQEKIHPKAIIENLKRQTKERREAEAEMPDFFTDFNGINPEAKTEFYQHDQNWQNRMILGDSLQVMVSLAEREGLRGQVQCIYFDPPYGIKFNSNWQVSTQSRDVSDGKLDQITREPQQVKAFRDTWKDGIHSYLTYLRDRLTAMRDLLTESGSIFVQIGDDNVHRVRAVMDEVFGEENRVALILVKKKGNQKAGMIEEINDYIVWYFKNRKTGKFRQLFEESVDESEITQQFSLVRHPKLGDLTVAQLAKQDGVSNLYKYQPDEIVKRHPGAELFTSGDIAIGGVRANQSHLFNHNGMVFDPGLGKGNCWKHTAHPDQGTSSGMARIARADRLYIGQTQIRYIRKFSDFGIQSLSNWWDGFGGASDRVFVVQTNTRIVERCILLTSDPCDLVLDPTCGSGTTATVAEQWGRRWITIDTSRVALALARARLMGALYPYYVLTDSPQGQKKDAELTRSTPTTAATRGNIRQGFVYERKRYITSSVIANNTEIDTIWETMQPAVDAARAALNSALRSHPIPFKVETGGRAGETINFNALGRIMLPSGESTPANGFMEWEIPREASDDWPDAAVKALDEFWQARSARQKEIDASIAAKAEFAYLYDRPIKTAQEFVLRDHSRSRVCHRTALFPQTKKNWLI